MESFQPVPTKLGFPGITCSSSSRLGVSSSITTPESRRCFSSSIPSSSSSNPASRRYLSLSISSSAFHNGLSCTTPEPIRCFSSSIPSSLNNPYLFSSISSSTFDSGSRTCCGSLSRSLFSTPPSSSPGERIFEDYEYPRVVEYNDIDSCLYLSRWSKPIRVLTGSKPVFGELFRDTKYAFRNSILTWPCYWLPPPITKRNKKYIIRVRKPKKGWNRLVTDASLVKKKTKYATPRAGCGFMLRNCSLEPICTGEWMVTDQPQHDIQFYEMLSLAQALKSMRLGWFPLEISTDNIFVIHILNNSTLKPYKYVMEGLLHTNLYEEPYLVLYHKIMALIQAQVIASNGQWGWEDIKFTSLPREANFSSDFLASTVKLPGVSIIKMPEENCLTIMPDQLHPLLNYIQNRDINFGFIKFHHGALKMSLLFIRRLKIGLLKPHEVPPEPE